MLRALRVFIIALALGCRPAAPPSSSQLADDAGVPVPPGLPARRIVSLNPVTTELLFALGAGDRLVGRTTWCDWPPEARAIPDLGNGIEPNVEAVTGARPDLVLLYRSASNQLAAGRFRSLGIPTLELTTDGLADLERAARLLGRILDRAAAAESLVAATEADLAAAQPPTPPARRPSVFILAWDRPPITLGKASFLSDIVWRAGARNVFDDLAIPSAPVAIEAVAARDPDFLLSRSEEEPAVAHRSEWQAVGAVRERRWLRVHGSEFDRPSPRIGQAVRQLRQALEAAGAGRRP